MIDSSARTIRVAFRITDPATGAGLAAYLRDHPTVVVLPTVNTADADVLIVVADDLTPAVITAETAAPVVLIYGNVEEADLFTVADSRVVAAFPRFAATRERLLNGIAAAAEGAEPLSASQLRGIHRSLQPGSPSAPALTAREVETLRLIAEGLGTVEIARRLNYSERTVKFIVYGVTQRLNLRNRVHLVAYAIRSGLI